VLRLSDINTFSKKCNKHLISGKVGSQYSYVSKKRAFSSGTIEKHMIGFCPWGSDIPFSVRYFGEDIDSDEKRDWKYNLWGRITVPIYGEFGKMVSLATKKPGEGKNPWWNFPFVKSNSLFLLDKAKSHAYKSNRIYIVEGYCDALTLYQNGLKNVVALMGTALTTRKVSLIARYCNNVVFCFDVDENKSGQRACDKAVSLLHSYSFCESISVIDSIPVGEDPDSYVKANGLPSYLSHERELSDEEIFEICERSNREG
jgi:DNA primase catalytic core